MAGGHILAILATAGRNNVDAYAAERLGTLESTRSQAGDQEAAARCAMVVAEGGSGSGYAYEAPDVVAARSRVPKVSAFDGTNQVYCVAHSHLKRTAQLAGIMQWMGLANDMSNPNFTPPSDAEIMMAYFNKMMAKQRWQRAGAALGALRALKMAGGGGMSGLLGGSKGLGAAAAAAAAAAPASPAAASSPGGAEETPSKRQPRHSQNEAKKKEEEEKKKEIAPDSPTESPVHPRISQSTPARAPRMSVSFVQGDSGASAVAKSKMTQLPKARDLRELMRELDGPFCFAILDARKEFILAGCSEDCQMDMLACVAPDGTLFFGTDPDSMPADCTIMEFPKGTYFCGRYNGNGDADLLFKKYAKVAAVVAAEGQAA